MSRVSENSSTAALNYSMGKSKNKLEDLQIKGTSLKRITKPSDDPVGNVQLLSMRSSGVDSDQYLRNATFAGTYMEFTESSLEDLSELLLKAKEIAIGQSSDIYNDDVRKNVSMEVNQIRKQVLGIANRKLGSRYLFSGYSTLTRPFDNEGRYYGDKGTISLEISKDFYVPINLTGTEVFIGSHDKYIPNDPLENSPLDLQKDVKEKKMEDEFTKQKRELAAENNANIEKMAQDTGSNTLFKTLEKLETALRTANPDAIQSLLPELDEAMSRIVTLRTRIGSITSSIQNTEQTIEKNKVYNEKHKSMIEDADVAELYTDMQKQHNILSATYKSGSNLLNRSLLDFLR